jgi:hypothetical protein
MLKPEYKKVQSEREIESKKLRTKLSKTTSQKLGEFLEFEVAKPGNSISPYEPIGVAIAEAIARLKSL